MSLLLAKLVATPLLVACASLLQRRFGGVVGGLFTGLPVTSAPLSVFLTVEYGAPFAARAAVGALLGLTAVGGFCMVYARVARSARWLPALAAATAASALLFLLLARLPPLPLVAALVTFPALCGMALLIGSPRAHAAVELPRWDLPARCGFSLLVVVGITAVAAHLGSTWSGLLATLPVLSAIMGSFTHRHAGTEAARGLLRGIVVGSLGAAAFNLVIATALGRVSNGHAYAAALLAAPIIALLGQFALSSRRPALPTTA